MKRTVLFIIAALTLVSSCQYIRPSDKIIARIGTRFLYYNDVVSLLPEGISPEDSAAKVQQYIDSWALAQLVELKAKEQLSKEEMDIKEEVEEYSRSLINFRFEKSYVESHLDTTITEAEKQEYFDTHTQSFTYPYALYRVKVITISTHSPYYDLVKKNFNSKDPDLQEELEITCRSYAEKYETYSNDWVAASTIAKDCSFEAELCEAALLKSGFYVKEDQEGEKTYFVYAQEVIAPGKLSPIEYNDKRIKDAILSKRKQDLLKTLKEDLLNEAYQNNKLKIYTND
ncbi:MAG: hypothetical protein J6Z27_01055 [Bacteroidales bacterium]|nr:hypothetical protein [Bacteroidales bacterium]